MGNIKIGTYLLVLGVCLVTHSNSLAETIAIDGKELVLREKTGTCFLYGKGLLIPQDNVLTLSPPCYFSRTGKGEIKSFSYPAQKIDQTFIVIGGSLSDGVRSEWGLSDNLVCGAEMQGILIKNNTVTFSNSTLKNGVFCRDTGIDEKKFWYFAHEKKE